MKKTKSLKDNQRRRMMLRQAHQKVLRRRWLFLANSVMPELAQAS